MNILKKLKKLTITEKTELRIKYITVFWIGFVVACFVMIIRYGY